MTVFPEAGRELDSTTEVSHGELPIPMWVRVVAVLGALLMAAGGVIAIVNPAMLVSPRDQVNGAVQVYAAYLASRNLCLSLMLLALLGLGARKALATLMVLTAFIQIADAAFDCAEGRWPIVPAVIVFGLAFLVAAARVSGSPFWKSVSWK